MTDAHSIDEEYTTSGLSHEVHNITMKRRSFSHDYYGSGSASHDVHNGDGDEVRATTPLVQLHPSTQELGDNPSMQLTSVETSLSPRQHRQICRQSESCSVSSRQRRRTRSDALMTGPVDTYRDDEHAINRERANTCPQHQFPESDEAVNFSGEDEESGGVGERDNEFRPHGSDSNERRTRSLPSSALLSPEYEAVVPSSSRRRAASASSIISPSTTAPLSPIHARSTTISSTTTTTSSLVSSYTTTLKHNLLKLLMLLSIYQTLSYTYNTGLSPDIKYQLGEINYDIEEYWYGGRLWSGNSNNQLKAARIVGSSGISFNDDYDGGMGEEGAEESDVGVVNYFISLILGDKFGFQEEGVGIVDDEEALYHEEAEPSSTNISSSKVGSQTKSEETTATPIRVANNNSNNNVTKRRPAMAHAITMSDARRPVYLPRTSSSSRRMKTTNDFHWSIPRIAGAIIWMGLMIPILEVGIREVSRRYRLGSLLRSRMRRLRFRRGSTENVHSL